MFKLHMSCSNGLNIISTYVLMYSGVNIVVRGGGEVLGPVGYSIRNKNLKIIFSFYIKLMIICSNIRSFRQVTNYLSF